VAIRKPRSKLGVTRQEFEVLVHAVEDCARSLELQFTRIAQIQAELDHIRAAWAKPKTPRRR
jgi:hypothetical protein